MAGGEDDGASVERVAVLGDGARDGLIADHEPCDPRVEADLAAGMADGFADVGDDLGQPVGADVGVRLIKDCVGGAVKMEELQGPAVVAALFRSRVELAVGKGARAALAEAVVGVRVERMFAMDQGDVALAAADILAALEHDRLESAFDQTQGREKSGRPRADDENRLFVRDVGVIEPHRFKNRRGLIGHSPYAEVDFDVPTPGVDGTAQNPHGGEARRFDPERLRDHGVEAFGGVGVLRRKGEVDFFSHVQARPRTKLALCVSGGRRPLRTV